MANILPKGYSRTPELSEARRAARRRRAPSAPELEPLVHERVRLGIISALAVNNTLSFSALKGLLNTTDGNLSVHARKLEEAGYIACTKSFHDRVPKTEFRLTAAGRQAFERYLGEMEALIRSARSPRG